MPARTETIILPGGKPLTVNALNGTVGPNGQNIPQDVLTIQRFLNHILKNGHLQGSFAANVPENANPRDGYTWMVVRRIQERYNLPRSGNGVMVAPGDATFKKLATLSATLSPLPKGLPYFSGPDPKDSFNLAVRYIKQIATGDVSPALRDLEAGKRVILGFRKTTSTKINNGIGAYDDLTVVMWKQNDAQNFIYSFISNTEPASAFEGRYGNDANGDKKPDLGRIPDGVYQFSKASRAGFGKEQEPLPGKKFGLNILKPKQDIWAERDIDHNGKFDQEDQKLIKKPAQMNSGKTFYFHKGGQNSTGSAGCQTMRQADFDAFWQKLGSQSDFYYILMTVA